MVQRGRIVPALPERLREIADGRASNLELEIVPGWRATVPRVELDGLRVAVMSFVVAAAPAEVDAPDERDVLVFSTGMPKDDELLMVTASSPNPLVEQDRTPGLAHHLHQVEVLLLAELLLVGVRAPHESAHVDAGATQTGEDRPDLRARAVQELLGVTSPIGEQDDVTLIELAERSVEATEVTRPVDAGDDLVPLGPCAPVRMAAVDPGRGIAPLFRSEKPPLRRFHRRRRSSRSDVCATPKRWAQEHNISQSPIEGSGQLPNIGPGI